MLRIVLGLGCALVLASCQTAAENVTPVAVAAAPMPANYRGQVADRVRATFFDPYSIRDAGISIPIAGQSLLGPMHTVCVRANAKNRMGGYIGIRETSYIFRNGQISLSDAEYAALTCANAVYEPFPEIDSAARR